MNKITIIEMSVISNHLQSTMLRDLEEMKSNL